MKIDQLPIEMLIKIFDFLTLYGQVSLVNKLFYDIVCKSNVCLRIDKRIFERLLHDSEYIWRIRTSKRQIPKVKIDCSIPMSDSPVCFSIIEKFSSSIKCLELANGTIVESYLLKILSLTPNVNRLDFKRLRIIIEEQLTQRQACHAEHDLNLKRLRCLSMCTCDRESVKILNRLPLGLITELKLDSVVLQQRHDKISASLSKQTKLKTLILSDSGPVDERVLNVVADLLELEVLSIGVTDGNLLALFVKLQTLTKLQNLIVRKWNSESSTDFQTFNESNNASIRKLTLRGNFKMSDDIIDAVAKSVPHLSQLSVHDVDGADTILRHFNFVNVLKMSFMDKHSAVGAAGDFFNSKLRELEIDVSKENVHFKPWLPKLIDAYPNLTKLSWSLHVSTFLNPEATRVDFSSIIDAFPKLESLKLHAIFLIVEDWSCLNSKSHNLKFMSLGRFSKRVTLTKDLPKNLHVRYSYCGKFYLVTDPNPIDSDTRKMYDWETDCGDHLGETICVSRNDSSGKNSFRH